MKPYELVGQKVLVTHNGGSNSCKFLATITDYKQSYGNHLFKLEPVGGTGFIWATMTSFDQTDYSDALRKIITEAKENDLLSAVIDEVIQEG